MKTRDKIRLAALAYRGLRLARRAVGRGDEAEVTRHGIRWLLDLSEGIDLSIYLLGRFEPRTASAYRRLIRPGQTVLDIGANIGAHALPFAALVGRAGRVIAFEPTDYAYRKLLANLALNPVLAPRIAAEQTRLGASDGDAPADAIYSSWPVDGRGALHAVHGGAAKTTAGAVQRRLDSYLAEAGVARVDFIKLDVDGYECEVLAGASGTLRRDRPPIGLELAPYALAERGASLGRLLAMLADAGYRLERERGRRPLPGEPAALAAAIGDGGSLNAIAVPATGRG